MIKNKFWLIQLTIWLTLFEYYIIIIIRLYKIKSTDNNNNNYNNNRPILIRKINLEI